MSQAVVIDAKEFRRFAGFCDDIAKLTNRSLEAVLQHQAGLFARDALFLTPPFGSNPIKESFNTQRKIGNAAVARDVGLVFKPLEDYKVMANSEGGIGKAVAKAVRQKRYDLAEALLNRVGLKPLAVIHKATVELFEAKRGKSFNIAGRAYRVVNKPSIKKVVAQVKEQVGRAKAGWLPAMRKFGAVERIPNWIKKHSGEGAAYTNPSKDKASVTIQNSVAYVQDRAPELVPLVWRIRTHILRRNIENIEDAMRLAAKKLQQGGPVDSVDKVKRAIEKAIPQTA